MAHALPDLLDQTHELPVFDVPEYTLFPHTVVPFHVYDERYGRMLDTALSDRRLLVVAGLQPGWEDQGATAPTYEVAGLGRVLSDRRFHDGRYNIFVHCIARVRILTTRHYTPYRSVDVEPLEDEPFEPEALSEPFDRLISLGSNLVRELGDSGAPLSKVLASTSDPAILSNRLAGMLVEPPLERQRLLEELSPLNRCQAVEKHLVQYMMEIPDSEDRPKWTN